MDSNEIDLEFMEQEAEERLTEREALLLGLPSDRGGPALNWEVNAFLLEGLD
jgi:hypothetical protein